MEIIRRIDLSSVIALERDLVVPCCMESVPGSGTDGVDSQRRTLDSFSCTQILLYQGAPEVLYVSMGFGLCPFSQESAGFFSIKAR